MLYAPRKIYFSHAIHFFQSRDCSFCIPHLCISRSHLSRTSSHYPLSRSPQAEINFLLPLIPIGLWWHLYLYLTPWSWGETEFCYSKICLFWDIGYCKMVIFKKQKSQEELFTSSFTCLVEFRQKTLLKEDKLPFFPLKSKPLSNLSP